MAKSSFNWIDGDVTPIEWILWSAEECMLGVNAFFQALVCNVKGEGNANCTNEMASWCLNNTWGWKAWSKPTRFNKLWMPM